MSIRTTKGTEGQKANMRGIQQDEFKKILRHEKKRIRIDIERELNKKYEYQKNTLERERRKFEQSLAKFRKDKIELTMLKQQVETEKKIFVTRLSNGQADDFKLAEVIRELQEAILESVNQKKQASDEWEKVRNYRKETEKLIQEKADKLKVKEAALKDLRQRELKHLMDCDDLEKRQNDLDETERAFESEVQKLQEWETRLHQEREDFMEQVKENKKKAEKVEEFERELLAKKGEFDMLEMNLEEKDIQLKELEEEIKISTITLRKEREEWDAEQKKIYFDKIYEEKRIEIDQKQQKLLKQIAATKRMKTAQEMTGADLHMQIETIEKKEKAMAKMNQQLEEQLAMIDKKNLETSKKEEDLNKRAKDLETAYNKTLEKKKELKIQQEQIQNEYSKLQAWFEKKVRKELAHEKQDIDEQRNKLEEESKELKLSIEAFKKEKTEFWNRKSKDEHEIIRLKGEIKQEKVATERSKARLEELRQGIDKMRYKAKQEEERLRKLSQQLESSRASLKVTVEKEILDKYKIMISYAETEREELIKERNEFASQRKKQKEEMLEIEELRGNLENEINERVGAVVADREDALARHEEEFSHKNEELQLELLKIEELQQAVKSAELENNELRRQSEERLKKAKSQLELFTYKEKDLIDEKRKHKDENNKMREALRLERTKQQESIDAQKGEIANSFLELQLRIKDLEKREELATDKLLRVAKEWEVIEREGEKLSEIATHMQVEAVRRVKSATNHKDEVQKVTKEAFQSKKHLLWSSTEVRKELPSYGHRPSMTVGEDGVLGVIPTLHSNVNSEVDPEERCSGNLQDNSVLQLKTVSSNSGTDTVSVVCQGLYQSHNRTDSLQTVLHLQNSKGTAPKPRPLHRHSARDKGYLKTPRIPSRLLIRMIESGEHTATTLFFLGPEKKTVKTIKGVIINISAKLKYLVENNEVVELPDITMEGFETMLEFVYSTRCSFTSENLVPTMACACKFGLDDLYRTCFDWLELNLSCSDAPRILDDCIKHAVALGTSAKWAVEKSAWDLMISDGEGVKDVLSKFFETRDFNWVRNVLVGNSLVCTEDILFDAVAHWACHQSGLKHPDRGGLTLDEWRKTDDEKANKNTESHTEVASRIAEIAPFVRFPTMPAKYLTKNKLISTILQPEEILEVLRYQHDPDISDTKYQALPRYKTIEVSQGGCCSQSSEHFAVIASDIDTAHYEKNSTGDEGSRGKTVHILTAGLAITKRSFNNNQVIESQNSLIVAQTKYDYQPWWDMDLGRLCRIQKVQVYLGEPIRSPEQTFLSKDEQKRNNMFPLVMCLARDGFPDMEGTLPQSVQMSVKTKYFDRAPTNRRSILVEWDPALVAARTFRIQCERQTILRILHVKIFSAEPLVSGPMPQIRNVTSS